MRNKCTVQPYSEFTHVYDCEEIEHRGALVALIDSMDLRFEVDDTQVYCSPTDRAQIDTIREHLGLPPVVELSKVKYDVYVGDKTDTQQRIKALRRSGLKVTGSSKDGYKCMQGKLTIFTAMPGSGGYLVRSAKGLFTQVS